jgi:hypothetical protein
MKLVHATEDDSSRLKQFFARTILPGPIDFSIQRHGSFFDQYRLQSSDFETLMLVNERNEIEGLATLIFREGLINGEKQVWGFATDLRIAPSRRAVLQWVHHFLPVFEEACQKRGCQFVFSAIQKYENHAYNALLRPQPGKRELPRYYLLNRFHVVALHGRRLFAPTPLPGIKISPAETKDVDAICAHFKRLAAKRPLALDYEPERFLARISRWPGLDLNDFRVARDHDGNILGVAAMWNGRGVQSFLPQTYNGFAHTTHQTLKMAAFFSPWLNDIRPLAEPPRPMPMRFLTHLACETPEAFHSLIHEAFSRLGKKEFLVYGHARGQYTTLPPKGYLATALPNGLYVTLPPNVTPPEWLLPGPQSLPPEFEVAWL